MRLWFKQFRQDEAKVESRLTKWVTYLVLLVAAVTMVGDLIATIYTFLQGEISGRFFLKALTILVVAGMIFGFYYLERKKVQYRADIPRSTFKLFGWVLTGIVLVGLVLGFSVAGSPATGRMYTFDAQRTDDLQRLSRCIGNFAQVYQRLPNTLDELEQSSQFSYCAGQRDPETGAPYTYRVTQPMQQVGLNTAEGTFSLCADFALAKSGDYYPTETAKWHDHTQGRACDTETVAVQTQGR